MTEADEYGPGGMFESGPNAEPERDDGDDGAGAETRWHVLSLPRTDNLVFNLTLSTPTIDPAVIAAIEEAAKAAGMVLYGRAQAVYLGLPKLDLRLREDGSRLMPEEDRDHCD